MCWKNRLTSQPGKPELMLLSRRSFIGLRFSYPLTVQKWFFPLVRLKAANLEARPLLAVVLTFRTTVCTARSWVQFYFKCVTGNVIIFTILKLTLFFWGGGGIPNMKYILTSSPFTLIPSPITTHILYINGRNDRLLETRCSSRSQNFEPSVLNPHAPTCYYVTRWLQSPSDVIANLSTTKNT